MKIAKFFYLILFLALAVACQDNEEKARIVVRLTDSPGDYDEVNIDLQDIQVHSENGGWRSLDNVNKGIYNLLEFTDGRETVLTSSEYPTGKITQIRLILGDKNSVEIDEDSIPLETPSAQQSGLKLLLNKELTSGITYAILLDFDAARSIVTTGNGKQILKPVIKVVSEAQDGAIEGKVLPADLTVAVFAIAGDDTLGTSYVQPGATDFFVGGLPAGTYKVGFDPGELSGYQKDSLENVVVELGKITQTETTELSQD
ncbi:MAG TPA: DUF4382 domain-containing protein [Cyclobacteriaceae bacterium]|nr:DUF4382 domain-containing protein [Cyclobacteriaceae bacterium]